jgi:hypothetical protein
MSRPVLAHWEFWVRPTIMVVLGRARKKAPQWQSPRANRPPQRTPVIQLPGGAVSVCSEYARPGTVALVMRSLIPAFKLPWLGHTAYELPETDVDGNHASLLNAEPGTASHDNTK